MSNFLSDAENAAQDFSGNSSSSGQDQSSGSSGSDSSNSGSGSSSGGLMSDLKTGGEDTMINNDVNSFMNKEGVPSGADSTVDKAVDSEASKFM